jgi:hypothetical protein
MQFFCYTANNCSLLCLSPYIKISQTDGRVVFSQLMFRTAIQLEGKSEDVSECLRLLRSGVRYADLVHWGERRFDGFAAWLGRAIRAGIIE